MIYIFLLFFYGLFFNLITAYDISYKNYSLRNKQETAVLILAYNRPEYFSECIKALEQNKEAAEIPFIFALDGGPNSRQKENIAILKKSKIKNKIILRRDRNYGCPKNHIDAYRFIFDWCKFKKMIMIQEDILISSTYIAFILNFHSWATKTYTNIGAVHGLAYNAFSFSEKENNKSLVIEDRQPWHFRTFCMNNAIWDRVKLIMYSYENFLDKIPTTELYTKARSKPAFWEEAHKIHTWALHLVQKKSIATASPNFLLSRYPLYFKTYFLSGSFNPDEDSILGLAFYMNDLVKLHSVVNRAVNIGKYGISPTSYYEVVFKDNQCLLQTIPNDSTLVDFTLTIP